MLVQSLLPPPYEMKLTLCMQAFAKTQPHISAEMMTSAITNLNKAGFLPDTICDVDKVYACELTKFLEGQVSALHNFCVKWAGQMERKYSRLTYQ